MIMLNGCSFVEQSHLELESIDWKNQYWPSLVDPEQDNIAASGASNTRIFRTTIDYIFSKQPDQIILGWTSLDREELPCANGDRMRLRVDCTSFENDQDSIQRAVHETWYRENHNEWLQFEQLIRYILIVQELCKQKQIRCWMFNAFHHNYLAYPGQPLRDNFNIKNHKHYHKHLDDLEHAKTLISCIDFSLWLWPPKTTLAQWAKQQGLEFETAGHPALSAQKAIADYIHQRLES